MPQAIEFLRRARARKGEELLEQLPLADVLEEPVPEPPIVLDPKLREMVVSLMAQALLKMHETQGDESDEQTSG